MALIASPGWGRVEGGRQGGGRGRYSAGRVTPLVTAEGMEQENSYKKQATQSIRYCGVKLTVKFVNNVASKRPAKERRIGITDVPERHSAQVSS